MNTIIKQLRFFVVSGVILFAAFTVNPLLASDADMAMPENSDQQTQLAPAPTTPANNSAASALGVSAGNLSAPIAASNNRDINPSPVLNIKQPNATAAPSAPATSRPVVNNKNTAAQEVGQFYSIKAGQFNDITRLEFEVSKGFTTQVRVINFPFRLMFDVPMPYKWNVPKVQLDNPALGRVLSSFHYGTLDSDTFRVIANLKMPISIDKAFLVPANGKNYRFIIDFKPADRLRALLNTSTLVVPSTEEHYLQLQEASQVSQEAIADQKRDLAVNQWIDSYLTNVNYPLPVISDPKRRVVVVVDPGHGGKDPGAMPSPDSTVREKNIVLQIGKLVAQDLEQNPEIAVVMTRRGDYFVPLKDRVLWAKKFNADLFVSIHADRAVDNSSSGFSVYTLSEKASDAQTQMIATQENKSDVVAGVDTTNEDSDVSRIIISLLQRVKVNDSVTLAKDVLGLVSENVKLLENPLRSAGFVVLKVPETPSILIETGFLSNPNDVTKLTDPNYQKLVAQKITEGLEKYLWVAGKLKQMPQGIQMSGQPVTLPSGINTATEANQ